MQKKQKAVYLGGAKPVDYVNGTGRANLIVGEEYAITFGSNWVGSIQLDEIEIGDVKIGDEKSFLNNSKSFRYFFKEGFELDWLLINS